MAKKMGADYTLAKPFEKEELLKAVKEVIGQFFIICHFLWIMTAKSITQISKNSFFCYDG